MGIKVEYIEIPKMDIKKSISDDFILFREWYESIGNEFPKDINYNLLELFENTTSKTIFEEISKEEVDELVALYIGDFCDHGPGKLKMVKNTTCLNIRNYINDQELIKRKCKTEVIHLWNFIITGRSILNLKPFKISDPVFKFCILSEYECQIIKTDLNEKFCFNTPDKVNKIPSIGSLLQAIENKKGNGLLITVA